MMLDKVSLRSKEKFTFLLFDLYLCTIIKPNISSERKFNAQFIKTNYIAPKQRYGHLHDEK